MILSKMLPCNINDYFCNLSGSESLSCDFFPRFGRQLLLLLKCGYSLTTTEVKNLLLNAIIHDATLLQSWDYSNFTDTTCQTVVWVISRHVVNGRKWSGLIALAIFDKVLSSPLNFDWVIGGVIEMIILSRTSYPRESSAHEAFLSWEISAWPMWISEIWILLYTKCFISFHSSVLGSLRKIFAPCSLPKMLWFQQCYTHSIGFLYNFIVQRYHSDM